MNNAENLSPYELILILKHANINEQNEFGNTNLIYATHYDNEYLVKKLIEKGADVNLKNNHGITALSIAKRKGNKEIIDMLIKAGAK